MLKFLIEKEFKQIRRNSFLPKMIIMMPLLMMLVFPFAANQEVKDVKLSIIDNDHSSYSERLVHKIGSSAYFKLTNISGSDKEAMRNIESGNADIILNIQPDFEKNIITEGVGRVMISANAVNGTKGGLGSSYLSMILNDYAEELRDDYGIQTKMALSEIPSFSVMPQYKFNPHLNYQVFMVPALMVMLLTLLCGFLPSLNIVGEKEAGTIEQMNVTPVSKIMFVMAKLIPYWFMGFLVLGVCMILAALVHGIFPVGSLFTIFLFATIYILVVSGMGLVISNYSDTMQQAMFVMFFFIMILLLMSGLFTPINSMPQWAQYITIFNPLKYFMQVMRLVYLKGSGFGEMIPQFLSLCAFAVALNTWAVFSYKKSN